MPARYFKPVTGFTDAAISAVRHAVIDGYPQSVEIRADGERNVGFSDHLSRWRPLYSLEELEDLVKFGAWEEIPAAEPELIAAHDETR